MVPSENGFDNFFQKHDDKIGQKAMSFDMVDYNDFRQNSEDYLGKILIVYFWDVWSWDACEKQTEALNRIAKKYPYKAAIVSFVRERIGLEERGFLQSKGVNFPIVPDAMEFGMKYHGYKTGIPVIFIVDEKGHYKKVVFDSNEIEPTVEELLK